MARPFIERKMNREFLPGVEEFPASAWSEEYNFPYKTMHAISLHHILNGFGTIQENVADSTKLYVNRWDVLRPTFYGREAAKGPTPGKPAARLTEPWLMAISEALLESPEYKEWKRLFDTGDFLGFKKLFEEVQIYDQPDEIDISGADGHLAIVTYSGDEYLYVRHAFAKWAAERYLQQHKRVHPRPIEIPYNDEESPPPARVAPPASVAPASAPRAPGSMSIVDMLN